MFENQEIKKQWEFKKAALSNGVEKKKEQDQAGREELWVQQGPSRTESSAARFQRYPGSATWLPLFICTGENQHRKETARYLKDTAVSVVLCTSVEEIPAWNSSLTEQDSYIHQKHYNIPGLFRLFTLKIKLEFNCCSAVNILCSEAADEKELCPIKHS